MYLKYCTSQSKKWGYRYPSYPRKLRLWWYTPLLATSDSKLNCEYSRSFLFMSEYHSSFHLPSAGPRSLDNKLDMKCCWCVDAQLCRLVLQRHYDGNVIFEVTSSRPNQSTAHDYQVVKYTNIGVLTCAVAVIKGVWMISSLKQCRTLTAKPGFHYSSWRPKLTGDRFPLPVNTGRVDRRAFPLAALT